MALLLLSLQWALPGLPLLSKLLLGATAAPIALFLSFMLIPGGKSELRSLKDDLTSAFFKGRPSDDSRAQPLSVTA